MSYENVKDRHAPQKTKKNAKSRINWVNENRKAFSQISKEKKPEFLFYEFQKIYELYIGRMLLFRGVIEDDFLDDGGYELVRFNTALEFLKDSGALSMMLQHFPKLESHDYNHDEEINIGSLKVMSDDFFEDSRYNREQRLPFIDIIRINCIILPYVDLLYEMLYDPVVVQDQSFYEFQNYIYSCGEDHELYQLLERLIKAEVIDEHDDHYVFKLKSNSALSYLLNKRFGFNKWTKLRKFGFLMDGYAISDTIENNKSAKSSELDKIFKKKNITQISEREEFYEPWMSLLTVKDLIIRFLVKPDEKTLLDRGTIDKEIEEGLFLMDKIIKMEKKILDGLNNKSPF